MARLGNKHTIAKDFPEETIAIANFGFRAAAF